GRESIGNAGALHHLSQLPHHRLWKGVVVELARTERFATGEALDIARIEEGADCHPVGLDMVGMGISSELVLGHDHLRPDAADHLDQAADRFLLARLPEGLRLAVARQRPTHADGLIVGMGLDCQQAQLAGAHLPLRARTSWINCGTILCTSPMTPRSASLKIGASGSLLMAMIVFAPFIPTVCCI